MSADGGRGHVHARERDRDRDRAPAPAQSASREAPSQPEAATAPMTPISFAKAFGWGAGAGGAAPTPPPAPPPSPLGRPVAAPGSAPERAADAAEARQRGAPDLTGVRVHTDARADGYARSLGADALTLGPDIFVARAAWNPGSVATNALLAHELHHAQNGQAGVVYRKRSTAPDTASVTTDPLDTEAPEIATPVAAIMSRASATTVEFRTLREVPIPRSAWGAVAMVVLALAGPRYEPEMVLAVRTELGAPPEFERSNSDILRVDTSTLLAITRPVEAWAHERGTALSLALPDQVLESRTLVDLFHSLTRPMAESIVGATVADLGVRLDFLSAQVLVELAWRRPPERQRMEDAFRAWTSSASLKGGRSPAATQEVEQAVVEYIESLGSATIVLAQVADIDRWSARKVVEFYQFTDRLPGLTETAQWDAGARGDLLARFDAEASSLKQETGTELLARSLREMVDRRQSAPLLAQLDALRPSDLAATFEAYTRMFGVGLPEDVRERVSTSLGRLVLARWLATLSDAEALHGALAFWGDDTQAIVEVFLATPPTRIQLMWDDSQVQRTLATLDVEQGYRVRIWAFGVGTPPMVVTERGLAEVSVWRLTQGVDTGTAAHLLLDLAPSLRPLLGVKLGTHSGTDGILLRQMADRDPVRGLRAAMTIAAREGDPALAEKAARQAGRLETLSRSLRTRQALLRGAGDGRGAAAVGDLVAGLDGVDRLLAVPAGSRHLNPFLDKLRSAVGDDAYWALLAEVGVDPVRIATARILEAGPDAGAVSALMWPLSLAQRRALRDDRSLATIWARLAGEPTLRDLFDENESPLAVDRVRAALESGELTRVLELVSAMTPAQREAFKSDPLYSKVYLAGDASWQRLFRRAVDTGEVPLGAAVASGPGAAQVAIEQLTPEQRDLLRRGYLLAHSGAPASEYETKTRELYLELRAELEAVATPAEVDDAVGRLTRAGDDDAATPESRRLAADIMLTRQRERLTGTAGMLADLGRTDDRASAAHARFLKQYHATGEVSLEEFGALRAANDEFERVMGEWSQEVASSQSWVKTGVTIAASLVIGALFPPLAPVVVAVAESVGCSAAAVSGVAVALGTTGATVGAGWAVKGADYSADEVTADVILGLASGAAGAFTQAAMRQVVVAETAEAAASASLAEALGKRALGLGAGAIGSGLEGAAGVTALRAYRGDFDGWGAEAAQAFTDGMVFFLAFAPIAAGVSRAAGHPEAEEPVRQSEGESGGRVVPHEREFGARASASAPAKQWPGGDVRVHKLAAEARGNATRMTDGHWQFTNESGTTVAEYSLGSHRDLKDVGARGFFQSHHGIQDKWAAEVRMPGYRRNDAPAILLRDSHAGTPHRAITDAQAAREAGRATRTYAEERALLQADFERAGVPADITAQHIAAQDEYFGRLYAAAAEGYSAPELERWFGNWKP